MNPTWKMPKASGTGLVLVAVAACSFVSCISPEAFNASLAEDGSPTPRDGGADSKGSGSGGSFAGVGGTGGADVVGARSDPTGAAGARGGGAGEAGQAGKAGKAGKAGSMGGAAAGQASGGMSGDAGRPGGSDQNPTGSGGSVGTEAAGGMAGRAAAGPGAAGGSGSRGSAGGETGGGGAAGHAGGAGRGGVTGTGGSPPATGPCATLCTNPTAISLPHAAANLGSDATCEEAKGSIQGGNCGNFVSPRTFKVNGVTVPCTTADWATVPPRRNGGYCFQASAGAHPYAYFVTF